MRLVRTVGKKGRKWEKLTCADTSAEGEHLLVDLLTAGFLGAVPETVGELGLAAVASNVVCSAAQLGVGDGEHVADAEFLFKFVSRDGSCEQEKSH